MGSLSICTGTAIKSEMPEERDWPYLWLGTPEVFQEARLYIFEFVELVPAQKRLLTIRVATLI